MKSMLIAVIGAGLGLAVPQSRQSDFIREFSASMILDESSDATDPTANASIGDLDGDRDLDIVLAKGRHDGVLDRVLLNNGKGRFTAKDLGPTKDASYSALLADVDGDKDLDVIVSNDSEAKHIYLNDGKANFTIAGQWGNPDWPTRFATVADLNGDGRPDIIAANRSPRPGTRSAYCLNDGNAQFRTCTELAVGPASQIVAADFDRDGDIDLVVPHRDGGDSVILYNDGKARFPRTANFGPSTTTASAAAAGDLNGDGWPDLVIGDFNVSTFVYLNDGRGRLSTGLQLKFDTLPAPRTIAIGDLNRDGRADVVIGYYAERGSVLFNEGSGRSFRHVRFGDASAAVYGVALGDVDGDGYADIVAARSGGPNVVYFNRPGLGVDTIVASERVASPILQPFNADLAKLGVWRGQSSFLLDYHWDVEVALSSLAPGRVAGETQRVSNGVPYCLTRLTLLEHKADGTYVFSDRGLTGCTYLDGFVEARWLDNGRVQWSWGVEGAPQRATATLERAGTPVPLLSPVGLTPSEPVLGVWRGLATEGTDTWGIEIGLERLVAGERAGRFVLYLPAPSGKGDFAWCPGQIVLKEKRPDGRYVFRQSGDKGPCADDDFRAEFVDGDRLRLEWFWSGGKTPDATATLERKK